MKILLTIFLASAFAIAEPINNWLLSEWIVKDEINEIPQGSLDLCNVFYRQENSKIICKITTRSPLDAAPEILLTLTDSKNSTLTFSSSRKSQNSLWNIFRGVCEVSFLLPENFCELVSLRVQLLDKNTQVTFDEGFVDFRDRRSLDNETGNCAWVHHGNQGLTYTSVFRGDGGSATEGFDEILELHQALNIPANFHMSGTLMTAAEWYDPSFNQWLRDGISEGWVAMLTSAYAQHIMPFVQDNMNNWAVNVEHDMIQTYYNYNATVAWVPERVWVAGCCYPNTGLVDQWLGDNWTQHGVQAVILDDWPHVDSNSDRKIHWMNNNNGITLRVIPIDGEFTGNCHYNPGAAISQISTTGQYGIIVYGTDWEAASEMADFNCPDCLENYTQVVTWVHDNYPAVGAWKLDAALTNPDFNGWGINVGNGTYGLIGGGDGYGGSDNSWYTHWAGTTSLSDYHAPQWNYGQVWNETYNSIIASPINNLSESAWYVMMTNLHETAWHDFMGGPISGWQHRYSAHIKNANPYTEAAHWANNEYEIPVNAFFSDIDKDGVGELCIHNDRIYAVFESRGGRAPWVFARGPSGYNYSVVGSDNTYWNETDGDYDEPSSNNHQAALADVSPNYRNDLYDLYIDEVTDSTAKIRMVHGSITKTVQVSSGKPYLDVRYDAGYQTCYLRTGFTPDLIDQIWNADMTRVYAPDVAYMGFRDPHTGATGAYILGNGGAAHQTEFGGTILRGDEIRGYERFGFLLFAGETSSPDSLGRIPEFEVLKTANLDHFGPKMSSNAVFVNANTVELSFSESVDIASAQNPANWSLTGFPQAYTVISATRQADWTRVRLTVSPNFAGGTSGQVIVSAVTDLNGNQVLLANNSATLAIPNGVTPHTIIIDGTKDFDLNNECLFAGTDTLTITWDSSAIYVGYWNKDLNTGDFFINFDTNQQNNSGASTGSWGRETFANPFRIEYQLAIEGGPNDISLNRWTGSAWQYRGFGQHTASSYNGYNANPYTEVRIPWSELGNPTGIALSVNITQENNQVTSRVFPPTNPTGTLINITQVYRIYQPYISGNLPLYGARTRNILTGDFAAITQMVIQESSGNVRLTWTAVNQAATYLIYRSLTSDGVYSEIGETANLTFEDTTNPIGGKAFYIVRSRGGI